MPTLTNKRILITRTRHQASDLAAQLEALGATTILIPTIEIAPPETYSGLDAALTSLRTYDWLLFTSANAVEAFHRRAQFQRLTQLPKHIAVIGPATLRAANAIGLTVDLVPPRYVAESLAEALLPEASGKSFLLIRAADARDTIPEALTAAGAIVTIAEAYRNQIPPDAIPALQALFGEPKNYPNAITFTSASTARNLIALLEAANLTLPPNIALASIGPVTSSALRDLGYEPTIEATESTILALIQALVSQLGYSDKQWLMITSTQRELLVSSVLNEIINGFKIDDFQTKIGVSREELRQIGVRLRAISEQDELLLNRQEVLVLQNALALTLLELGIEEFQTRTGYDFEFGVKTQGYLNQFLNEGSSPTVT